MSPEVIRGEAPQWVVTTPGAAITPAFTVAAIARRRKTAAIWNIIDV